MSLTQLQAYYQPWLKKRSFKRELILSQRNAEKYIKATLRKTRRKSLAAVRRQYYLNTAVADVRVAVGRNEDIAITMFIIALVIGYSAAAMMLDLMITAFSTAFVAADVTKTNPVIFMLIAGGTLTIICGWILAFIMNMQSLALMDGALRKTKRSVRSTVRKGLRYSTRVTGAWVLLLSILIGIPVLAALTASSYLSLTSITMNQLFAYIPYGVTAGITWMVIILMEYSLVPYVALFEPTTPVRQLLTRSTQLVTRRGRIFLLAFHITVGTSLYGAYKLAEISERYMKVHRGLQFFSYGLILLLLANAVLVMFYRKRKLARTN